MERGASAVLTARDGQAGEASAVGRGTRGPLRRALAGLGNTCALACVALLGCVALVTLGTVASLLWMLVAEH